MNFEPDRNYDPDPKYIARDALFRKWRGAALVTLVLLVAAAAWFFTAPHR